MTRLTLLGGLAASAVTALTLGAFAQSAPPAAPEPADSIDNVSYACANNEVLHVTFVNTAGGNSYAIVLEQDELVPMDNTPSASGAVYRAISPDYNLELLTKGNEATLMATTDGKDDPVKTDCKS